MKQLFYENIILGILSILLGTVIHYLEYANIKFPDYTIPVFIIINLFSIIIFLYYIKNNNIKCYSNSILREVNSDILSYVGRIVVPIVLITYLWKKEIGTFIELTPQLILYISGFILISRYFMYLKKIHT